MRQQEVDNFCINNLCVCVCFRPRGERRVSGRDDGLPADADGGFLPEPGDRAALPQRDRESLLRPAPQRPDAALPDEGRPGGHGGHRPHVSAGRKLPSLTANNGQLITNQKDSAICGNKCCVDIFT